MDFTNNYAKVQFNKYNNEGVSIFIGTRAGEKSDDLYENLVIGYEALTSSTISFQNIIIGNMTSKNTSTISKSICIGHNCAPIMSGNDNVVVGVQACADAILNSGLVVIGTRANAKGNDCIVVGRDNSVVGDANIVIGTATIVDGTNNIVFSNNANHLSSNAIIIGDQTHTHCTIANLMTIADNDTHLRTSLTVDHDARIQRTLHVHGDVMCEGDAQFASDVFVKDWSISVESDGLMFKNGKNYVRFDRVFEVGVLNFTGQHKCFFMDPASTPIIPGMIVVSLGTYRNLDETTTPSINESIPEVTLSSCRCDKRVFGVVSAPSKDVSEFACGFVRFSHTKMQRACINSCGEGGIWVCDEGGPLQNGDLITTSSRPGYGCKQDDDVVRNYTVAKITCDCTFGMHDVAFVGCVYLV